jgi:hypothetical protein
VCKETANVELSHNAVRPIAVLALESRHKVFHEYPSMYRVGQSPEEYLRVNWLVETARNPKGLVLGRIDSRQTATPQRQLRGF